MNGNDAGRSRPELDHWMCSWQPCTVGPVSLTYYSLLKVAAQHTSHPVTHPRQPALGPLGWAGLGWRVGASARLRVPSLLRSWRMQTVTNRPLLPLLALVQLPPSALSIHLLLLCCLPSRRSIPFHSIPSHSDFHAVRVRVRFGSRSLTPSDHQLTRPVQSAGQRREGRRRAREEEGGGGIGTEAHCHNQWLSPHWLPRRQSTAGLSRRAGTLAFAFAFALGWGSPPTHRNCDDPCSSCATELR